MYAENKDDILLMFSYLTSFGKHRLITVMLTLCNHWNNTQLWSQWSWLYRVFQ